MNHLTADAFREQIRQKLSENIGITEQMAENKDLYQAVSMIVSEMAQENYTRFISKANSSGHKRIYYLSMEFLMGRSLKTTLYNLGLVDTVEEALKDYHVTLEDLYDYEPDAGLGNGGLGRLAACYMDSLATLGYPATGYSICYEFGIFKQKIIEGWQNELPDNWLPGGEVWLHQVPDRTVEVHFGGELEETWEDGFHFVNHKNYDTVQAVPYDMYVSGFGGKGTSQLRLWRAQSPAFDMEKFNSGDYVNALGQTAVAQAISKVLYPNDNHTEGKLLRLRQQYFLSAASIGDIITRHMATYGTLDNLADKVAIHINDTHPTLAIPELMRLLLDECGYSWEKAWDITTKTFAYTNHTVMSEALECWNESIFKMLLPRIYQIVVEINNRFMNDVYDTFGDSGKVERLAIIANHQVRMAHLCIVGSHSVNGVSKLHSQILKDDVFHDFYVMMPQKFTNVTNGIAYRRWLYQSNPGLTKLLQEHIGDGFLTDGSELKKIRKYENDKTFLKSLNKVKRENKVNFSNYVKKTTGLVLNPDSIFDVQVKRLHEYKRQHLNALNIMTEYRMLLENPDMDFVPKTYIFGAKAAPGYYLAKQIIKLICTLAKEIDGNKKIREKLSVVFLEDYRVTLSELLMPASEISEQISLAGTEASGTGNMKLMLNGAITLGTLDGANIEIGDAVGPENIITFGMKADEVAALKASGYHPQQYYQNNPAIRAAVDMLTNGIGGERFDEVANQIKNLDTYMALADFDSYRAAQAKVSELYRDPVKFAKMSLVNIAEAGIFSADRAIQEYAHNIWRLD
ncbi:MAG: glycogen/starch/alpha-glucan phosphorylase [Oscillospiraceae bacterium]|jgi:starch phosphorylase